MDKAKLLAKREASYRDVEVDVGTVRVRGLNRAEVKACQDDDGNTVENKLIAAGMVDPVLTEAEVGEWLATAPAGDFVAVMTALSELSGLAEGAAQKSVSGVRRPKKRR